MYVAEQKVDYRKIHRPMVTPVSQLQYLLLGGPASRLRRRVIGQESVGLRGVLTGVFGLGRCLFFFLVFFCVVSVRDTVRRRRKEHTKLDDHLAPGDVALAQLETIGDATPATEFDGLAVWRVGVLVF